MIKTFKEWAILKEAATQNIIVYHGTSPKHFQSIMSQGLIADPKKKAWEKDDNTSFYSPSRVSLSGIYVTTNLMTALSAAGNGANSIKDGQLIVIASIQPKTGFMDEDDLNILSQVSSHEYVLANLYKLSITDPNNKELLDFYNRYKQTFQNILINKLKKEPHQNLNARLEPLLWDLFISALQRQVAHIDDYTYKRAMDFNDSIPQPDKTEAEMQFLKTKEILTKTLKGLANIHNYKDGNVFNFTSRIMQPINFKEPNKILAIVLLNGYKKEQPKVLFGKVPEKFIEDYTKSVGQWNL